MRMDAKLNTWLAQKALEFCLFSLSPGVTETKPHPKPWKAIPGPVVCAGGSKGLTEHKAGHHPGTSTLSPPQFQGKLTEMADH